MTERKGFLLLEIVIAIGIAVMIIVGSQTVLAHSLLVGNETVERMAAQGLLAETEVAIRSIAHDDWAALDPNPMVRVVVLDEGWHVQSGSETLTLNGIAYQRLITISGVNRAKRDAQGVVSGDIVTQGGFNDPDTRKATIAISWVGPRAGSHQLDSELLVTNWESPTGSATPEPVFDGASLQGVWQLDETTGKLIDSTMQGNNLSAHGSLQYGVAGISGTAIGFDSKSDYADIKDKDAQGLDGEGPLVIKAYILRNLSQGTGDIVKKWGEGKDASYRLTVSKSGKLSFQVKNGSKSAKISTKSRSVPTGVWTAVTAVYSGSQLQLYINGVSAVSPKNYTGGIGDSDAAFTVGGSRAAKGFDGAIDDLRVYRILDSVQP